MWGGHRDLFQGALSRGCRSRSSREPGGWRERHWRGQELWWGLEPTTPELDRHRPCPQAPVHGAFFLETLRGACLPPGSGSLGWGVLARCFVPKGMFSLDVEPLCGQASPQAPPCPAASCCSGVPGRAASLVLQAPSARRTPVFCTQWLGHGAPPQQGWRGKDFPGNAGAYLGLAWGGHPEGWPGEGGSLRQAGGTWAELGKVEWGTQQEGPGSHCSGWSSQTVSVSAPQRNQSLQDACAQGRRGELF